VETRLVRVPILPEGEPGGISRVWSRLLRFALALWVRRLERQLAQSILAPRPSATSA
jgi:hypothetical protein